VLLEEADQACDGTAGFAPAIRADRADLLHNRILR
jgi:hypothetical protein